MVESSSSAPLYYQKNHHLSVVPTCKVRRFSRSFFLLQVVLVAFSLAEAGFVLPGRTSPRQRLDDNNRFSSTPIYFSNKRGKNNYLPLDDDSQIPILYESDRLLIVNKPAGIAHHNDRVEVSVENEEDPKTREDALGIVNLVRRQQGQRLWGVHRLDRVTSGILVFAKDAPMAQALSQSFANGDVSKLYTGISAKRPTKKKQGWVKGRMVRSRDKSWKLTRGSSVEGQQATTRFFTAPFLVDDQHKFTLLLFRPYTGKTHQLRVAAKSMGMPLFGDPIYKDGSRASESDDGPSPERTYLHATGILLPSFEDLGRESVTLWCPPPFDNLTGAKVLVELMEKHCDVPELLEAMRASFIED